MCDCDCEGCGDCCADEAPHPVVYHTPAQCLAYMRRSKHPMTVAYWKHRSQDEERVKQQVKLLKAFEAGGRIRYA